MSKLQSKKFLNISCIVEDNTPSNWRQKLGDKLDTAIIKLEKYKTEHPAEFKRRMNAFHALNIGVHGYLLYKMLHGSDDNETGEDNLANNDHES
jgi:hypothetical protein